MFIIIFRSEEELPEGYFRHVKLFSETLCANTLNNLKDPLSQINAPSQPLRSSRLYPEKPLSNKQNLLQILLRNRVKLFYLLSFILINKTLRIIFCSKVKLKVRILPSVWKTSSISKHPRPSKTYEWTDGIVSHLTDKPEATGAVSSFYPISQSVIRFTGNSSYFKSKGKERSVVETRI